MENKKIIAVKLIKDKIIGKNMMTYKEIAHVTDYHPKYILKLKKELLEGSIKLVHGNKNKRSKKAISLEEEEKIINLYKKSTVSIRRFVKFYNTRSYSCIYNILDKRGLIEKEDEKVGS